MSLAILNSENALNYLEVRGMPVEVVPDPTGELYVHLGVRYGDSGQQRRRRTVPTASSW